MPYETIQLEVDGPVARLRLSRPDKLNALDDAMLDELTDALDRLARADDVSSVLLTAEGRAFSAGVDTRSGLFLQPGEPADAHAATRSLNRQHRIIAALYELPQLTIAGINGPAIGGAGFGLAMACDIRVAGRSARFRMIPGMLDLIQDFGLTWLLQRQIGPSRTLHMAVMGDVVPAEEAQHSGFVDVVVEDAELEAHLDDLAARLRPVGVDALRMLKLLVRAGGRTTLRDQLGLEAVANGLNVQSSAFADKRNAYVDGLKRRGPAEPPSRAAARR